MPSVYQQQLVSLSADTAQPGWTSCMQQVVAQAPAAADQPQQLPPASASREKHKNGLFSGSQGGHTKTKGHAKQHVCSLLVMAQVLRLVLALTADHSAAAQTDHHLRAQLLKELKAAAAHAALSGKHNLDARTLIKHLPPARLQQIRAAAKRRPRGSNRGGVSGAAAHVTHRTHPASASHKSQLAADLTAQHTAGPSTVGHWQQQQQPAVDVGCLLETTLVAAAVEAKLTTFCIGGGSSTAKNNSSLQDDATSCVDIEGVMREEFELAQLDGML